MDQVLNGTRTFLEQLISSYLKRSGPQDIYLLKNRIQDTVGLATSINSDLDQGLTIFNATSNTNVYGSNIKKVSEDHKLCQLYKIVKSQLFKLKCALLLITIFMQFICGFIWNNTQMKRTSIFIEVLICLSLISKIYLRWRSFSIICKENYGKKPTNVHAYRNGEKIQIIDTQITVGDVLFIDFNQTIPVSGILISPLEIAVDEDYIGKGIQKKLNFQQCIKHIENKNELQLKIEYENGTLPSPVLIRGSRIVQGGAFKMLVISTEETSLLQKYDKSPSSGQKLGEKSIIEQWINSISIDLQHISQVCFIIILVFHTIAMVFKVLGLPSDNYFYLMQNIIDQLYTIIAASFLLDANILIDLFKAEYINVLNLVQRVQELDKVLSVEQIIITDQNICKYDEIKTKKIVLCDIYEPVDIKLLPAMQETIHYNILYEILGGVQLDSDLPHKILHKCHKNAIIHVNNSQQKIFSSLYEQTYSIDASFLAQEQGSAVGLCKGNKVGASKPNVSILSASVPHQCSLTQQNKKVQRHNNLQTLSISKKVGHKTDDKLQEYLNKQCPFSTQHIIEGINKLAEHQSRTYYFQKFSIQRLSKSKYIWNHGKFTPIKTEDRDRLLVGVKKLEKQNLTVYLIGIDWGAFSNQYMGYLFGAIGVQISQQYKIIQKLKQLEKIGVSSLITIFKNNFEEMNELQRHQYQYDFLKRGWMNQNQHFSKLQQIKRAGGRKMCRICLLSRCQCRPKGEELSNVQGFLMAIQDVKCIYNITQEDIQYIELGFEQLNVTTLRIIDRKEETIGRLNQIIIGHQLINKLQENLSFWILNILIIFFCCLPINYMTFGSILCYEQLYFYFIYVQLLFAKNHFIQHSEQDVWEQKGQSRRNKNLLGWNIKGDILIFLFLLTASCITMIYFPKIFVKQSLSQYLSQYTCTVTKSFYHNPNIKTHVCQNGAKTVILYPKLSTFIFLVTMFAITFKTFISTQRIVTLINIGWHFALVGVLMIFTYLCPALLHLCHHGLNGFEFALALLIAFSIAILSKLNGWIIGALQGGKRFQLTLNLSAGKQYNQYSQILKQYKQQKTLKYPYEQQ